MRNCAKDSENERDHIVIPKNEGAPPARRQTYSDGRGRAGLASGEWGTNIVKHLKCEREGETYLIFHRYLIDWCSRTRVYKKTMGYISLLRSFEFKVCYKF